MKRLINRDIPVIMGIVNLTPDSFYDGGTYTDISNIMNKIQQYIDEGVGIVDVGAMSTKPGSKILPQSEEMGRLSHIIPKLKAKFNQILFSIDTIYGQTANYCLDNGFDIVNDVSAGSIDPSIFEVVAKYGCPYVLMHSSDIPETMQHNPIYDNVILEIIQFFQQKLKTLRKYGIEDVIVDPGFGFGKSTDHNFKILKSLSTFKMLGKPILAGISRKSMICKTLQISPKDEEALLATSALHMIALANGANILRVHDVKAAAHAIELHRCLASA